MSLQQKQCISVLSSAHSLLLLCSAHLTWARVLSWILLRLKLYLILLILHLLVLTIWPTLKMVTEWNPIRLALTIPFWSSRYGVQRSGHCIGEKITSRSPHSQINSLPMTCGDPFFAVLVTTLNFTLTNTNSWTTTLTNAKPLLITWRTHYLKRWNLPLFVRTLVMLKQSKMSGLWMMMTNQMIFFLPLIWR